MISVSEEFKIQFKKLSKRYKSLKSDIQELSDELKANPDLGTELFHNVRKVRLSIKSKGKGKRGGARISAIILNEKFVFPDSMRLTYCGETPSFWLYQNESKNFPACNLRYTRQLFVTILATFRFPCATWHLLQMLKVCRSDESPKSLTSFLSLSVLLK